MALLDHWKSHYTYTLNSLSLLQNSAKTQSGSVFIFLCLLYACCLWLCCALIHYMVGGGITNTISTSKWYHAIFRCPSFTQTHNTHSHIKCTPGTDEPSFKQKRRHTNTTVLAAVVFFWIDKIPTKKITINKCIYIVHLVCCQRIYRIYRRGDDDEYSIVQVEWKLFST